MIFKLIELTGIPLSRFCQEGRLLTCHVTDPAFGADGDLTSWLTMHIPKSGTMGVILYSSTTRFSCNDIDEFYGVEGNSAHLQGIR